jgi:hypothetical protein
MLSGLPIRSYSKLALSSLTERPSLDSSVHSQLVGLLEKGLTAQGSDSRKPRYQATHKSGAEKDEKEHVATGTVPSTRLGRGLEQRTLLHTKDL